MAARPALLLAAIALGLAACAAQPLNVKLDRYDPSVGYRYQNLSADDNTDDLFVILAFSGGGIRAAAFSFGVMEALADVEYHAAGRARRLLQDVDVIASVSGGSFTAAYYALFPDTFFRKFPEEFLHRNIERALIGRALRPWNWVRLARSDFDRVHLAVELYDETVFHATTFGDLLARGRKPFIILNATDMTLGRRFEFTQEQFDLLCSDVAKTTIAAGVAASSAFPGLLSPLTLENFAADGCGFRTPEWLETGLVREQNPLERYARARDLASYQDPAQGRRYVHLLDGGLADNIGLRGPYVALKTGDTEWNIPARISAGAIRRVVVITANAKTKPRKDWDRHAAAPGLVDVLSFVTSGPMDNYSFDTVQLIRNFFSEQRQAERARASCLRAMQKTCPEARLEGDLPPADYHAIELSFDAISDERVHVCLENLPTSFALEEAQVTLLRQAGRALLMGSREFQEAMRQIDPDWRPAEKPLHPGLIAKACPETTPLTVAR
jgi:predicted acylesterase/phospholipase RssA